MTAEEQAVFFDHLGRVSGGSFRRQVQFAGMIEALGEDGHNAVRDLSEIWQSMPD